MAGSIRDRFEQYYAKDRKAWRKWLEKHYATSPGILLVYYKKSSGMQRLEYSDAVEEALCFGWIDTTAYPIDDERYAQLFTPRKPKSNWVKSNKERVARLIEQGLMTPAGLAKIEAAKKDGSWDRLTEVENLTVPPELKNALSAKKGALANYTALTPGKQKQILYWLHNAKREETRAKRIAAIVKAVAAGEMPVP